MFENIMWTGDDDLQIYFVWPNLVLRSISQVSLSHLCMIVLLFFNQERMGRHIHETKSIIKREGRVCIPLVAPSFINIDTQVLDR